MLTPAIIADTDGPASFTADTYVIHVPSLQREKARE